MKIRLFLAISVDSKNYENFAIIVELETIISGIFNKKSVFFPIEYSFSSATAFSFYVHHLITWSVTNFLNISTQKNGFNIVHTTSISLPYLFGNGKDQFLRSKIYFQKLLKEIVKRRFGGTQTDKFFEMWDLDKLMHNYFPFDST